MSGSRSIFPIFLWAETMTHTPGPWQVHHSHDVAGYPCYFIHGFSGQQKNDKAMHDANARLISAAPDLVAALLAAKAFGSQGDTHEGFSVSQIIDLALQKAGV